MSVASVSPVLSAKKRKSSRTPPRPHLPRELSGTITPKAFALEPLLECEELPQATQMQPDSCTLCLPVCIVELSIP